MKEVKMKEVRSKLIDSYTINYKDGTTEKITKGMLVGIIKSDKEDFVICIQCANLEKKEGNNIFKAIDEVAQELGVY